MILDDLVDYLSSGGIGTPGTTMFRGFLPDSPDEALALYETGGQAPVHAMTPGPTVGGAGVAVIEQPRVQVVCRAPSYDYDTARATAHSVFKLLDGMPARTINTTEYLWAAAVQSPFLMGRDQAGRVLIATNYDVAKRVSA